LKSENMSDSVSTSSKKGKLFGGISAEESTSYVNGHDSFRAPLNFETSIKLKTHKSKRKSTDQEIFSTQSLQTKNFKEEVDGNLNISSKSVKKSLNSTTSSLFDVPMKASLSSHQTTPNLSNNNSAKSKSKYLNNYDSEAASTSSQNDFIKPHGIKKELMFDSATDDNFSLSSEKVRKSKHRKRLSSTSYNDDSRLRVSLPPTIGANNFEPTSTSSVKKAHKSKRSHDEHGDTLVIKANIMYDGHNISKASQLMVDNIKTEYDSEVSTSRSSVKKHHKHRI